MSEFKTTDLALAATIALFLRMPDIKKLSSGKCEFHFQQEEDLDKLIPAFWRGELLVEPRRFFESMRAIKSQIYN